MRYRSLINLIVCACCISGTQGLAQPLPLDTLLAPSATASGGFGWSLDSGIGGDGFARLLLLEPFRSPDGAAYLLFYDGIAQMWVTEDSLGSKMPGGGLGEVELASGTHPPLAAIRNTGDVALWRKAETDAGGWSLEAFLEGVSKPGIGGLCFGCALSSTLLSSNEELVFVGAQNGGDIASTVREGSAYAFVRPPGVPPSPDAWQMEARILAPDGLEGDEFGASVALLPSPFTAPGGGHAGDALVLIGARKHPRGEGTDGAVYAYVRDGATGTWIFEEKLPAPDTTPTDGDTPEFGDEVAAVQLPAGSAGEALLYVGAPDHGICGAINGGSSYVYRREVESGAPTDFGWAFETRLCPSDPRFEGRWGGSVDLRVVGPGEGDVEGTVLAIAGQTFDPGPDIPPGAADPYVRSTTGAWSHRARYETGADGVPFDAFGYSVALVGPGPGGPPTGQVLVGAFLSDLAAPSAGNVFIYDPSVGTANEPEAPEVSAGLSVRPNPVRGAATVTLTLERPDHIRVAVYDVLGREVVVVFEGELPAGDKALVVDLHQIPSGTYVLKASGISAATSQRITVVK